MNLILAHFVVTPKAAREDLDQLFKQTPAHIVVVTYDAAVAAEEQFRETTEILEAMGDRWHAHFMTHGVVLGLKCRIASLTCKETYVFGGHVFVCVEAAVAESHLNPRTAVAVGAVYDAHQCRFYGGFSPGFVFKVRAAIKELNVRFVAGLFSCPKEDVQSLFSNLNVHGDCPFFQPLWTEDPNTLGPEVNVPAVAERFRVWPRDVKKIVVYPAYIVILGPCWEIKVPEIQQAPWWNSRWAPKDSTIDQRVKPLSSVPIWQCDPQLRPQGEADRSCGLMQFGQVKQKEASEWWRINGVHQLILWVGSSRPSQQSKANRSKHSKANRSKTNRWQRPW